MPTGNTVCVPCVLDRERPSPDHYRGSIGIVHCLQRVQRCLGHTAPCAPTLPVGANGQYFRQVMGAILRPLRGSPAPRITAKSDDGNSMCVAPRTPRLIVVRPAKGKICYNLRRLRPRQLTGASVSHLQRLQEATSTLRWPLAQQYLHQSCQYQALLPPR